MIGGRTRLLFIAGVIWTAVLASVSFAVDSASPMRVGGVIAHSPLWTEWSSRFLSLDGRIVDTANAGVSHSEGQGYGMLLAVAAGDRPAFDRIWGWTRSHLRTRYDHLFAWRWDPAKNGVLDNNDAADGDILIAWSLAEAGDLWRAPEYSDSAREIADDIGDKLIRTAPGVGPVLLPAAFGFAEGDQTDGPVVNPSYWVFPAFARLAQLAPDHDWRAVRRSGLAIIESMQAAPNRLPTDWVSLANGRPAPARRFPAKMSYDALRIPLYLGFTDLSEANVLKEVDRTWFDFADGLPIVDVAKGEVQGIAGGRSYRALRALRSCAMSGAPYPPEFYHLSRTAGYYPTTLHMLALVSALSQPNACLDRAEALRLQPEGSMRVIASAPQRAEVVSAAARSEHVATRFTPATFTPSRAPDPAPPPAEAGDALLEICALSVVVLVAALAWVRSRRSKPEEYFVAPLADAAAQPARSPAPRCLPHNPFDDSKSSRALEERLDIAAVESRRWRRTVGVAYFRIPDFDALNRADSGAAQRQVDAIVSVLRARIRPSDAVAVVGPGEIAVCLCLIADTVDLTSVGRRLTSALAGAYSFGSPPEQAFGLALYPAHGAGAACLEEARRAYHAVHPELEYTPRFEDKGPRRRASGKTAASRKAMRKRMGDAPA